MNRIRDVSNRRRTAAAGCLGAGALLSLLPAPATAAAQAAAAVAASAPVGVDQRINDAASPVSNFIAGIIFYSVPIGGTVFPLSRGLRWRYHWVGPARPSG